MTYLPRDYVATGDGLLFAVVASDMEDGRVLGCLRYVRHQGRPRKMGSAEADAYLRERHPGYRFYSVQRDVWLHAVPVEDVAVHYRPRERLQELLRAGSGLDLLEARAVRLLGIFAAAGLPMAAFGITGSLLVGLQGPGSDIDLVVYDRDAFHALRRQLPLLIDQGRLDNLDVPAWREAYRRRGCSLSLDEYLWHERRKHNKALFEGTKFDVGLVVPGSPESLVARRKLGLCRVRLRVTDDRFAFDFPARYLVDQEGIVEVASFTATYTGQAVAGEWIEVAGWLEEMPDGRRRIVIGSDREAQGQYLRMAR